MNFTQSFEEFSSGLSTMDLALYAGAGIIIWVLFKDRLSPVQKIVLDTVEKLKEYLKLDSKTTPVSKIKVPDHLKDAPVEAQNLFFDLVVSWKQTRDLAEKSGCEKAVQVADEMFPYLSPTVCADKPAKKDYEL